MEAPASLKGQLLACPKCGSHQTVKNSYLKKILLISGLAFVLIVSIYIYRYILYPDPQNLDWAEKILTQNKLFLLTPVGQDGIFRGRNLTEYKFSQNATHVYPYLSVWADRKNNIVGVSVHWDEYIEGVIRPDHSSPTDDLQEWLINYNIRNGLELLTGWTGLYVVQHDGKFHFNYDYDEIIRAARIEALAKNEELEKAIVDVAKKMKIDKQNDKEIYDESYKKWSIIITRWKINDENQVCIGYTYLATAQTW